MALTENGFEKQNFEKESHYFGNYHPSFELTPEEEEVLRRHNKVENDPEAAAEEWAVKLVDELYDVANIVEGNSSSGQFFHYFMLEDEHHKLANEFFADKLGIEPYNPNAANEVEKLFQVGNVVLSRQAFYYEENDPSTLYGVSYVASPIDSALGDSQTLAS